MTVIYTAHQFVFMVIGSSLLPFFSLFANRICLHKLCCLN